MHTTGETIPGTTPAPAEIQNRIAIVGMDCRFPGAPNLEQYWNNLRDGVESITFFTEDELRAAGQDPSLLRRPGYVNAGSLLDAPELFDAEFFGFSARDAEILDPQQRLFLESAWNALEHAGYVPELYPGLIGVFGGVDFSRYVLQLFANHRIVESMGAFQISLGNDKDHLTTRTAYKLNLKGPAVTVQTTCSTSLVAVCLACENLLQYQCDMALAGGSALNIPQRTGYVYQEGGISSPDGHCRPFDARARGTISGSGVGMVVLKRLEDALADGDCVHGVICGFGLNNDGALKVGYTAPSIEGQADVIAAAHATAGFAPDSITYVEAHGTATPLGDPIEVAALTRVFRASTDRRQFCALGSVKSNFGHLNSAAGVAGLIKTVLALRHRQIPPSLHFEQPNPEIDFAQSPFFVVDRLMDWPVNGTPRRAGVSSFGIGGTNAHLVLEEAPAAAPTATAIPWQLLVISARTPSALAQAADALAAGIETTPARDLADVAYTLQVGRKAFDHRLAVVAPSADPAKAAAAVRAGVGRRAKNKPAVVFLFSGQGTQHPGMGRDLYEHEPVFRDHVDQCCRWLEAPLGLDLRELLYPPDAASEAAAEQLTRTSLAQPALFVIEYALARLWMSWGVRPAAVGGHSVGEYVAACLAEVWELAPALALVAERGRLMEQTAAGAMLAVLRPPEEVASVLSGGLALAVINGPSACVVAGPSDEIARFESEMVAAQHPVRRLHTSHAFHSPLMDPAMAPFTERVRAAAPRAPRLPLLSNLTGTWMTAAQATDPGSWGRHLRETVRFDSNLRELFREPRHVLLEVGPGDVLASLATRHPQRPADIPVHPSLPHARDAQPAGRTMLHAAGQLWTAGVDLDWTTLRRGEHRRRVPLPTYPFERQRYWVDPPAMPSVSAAPPPGLPRQSGGRKLPDLTQWFYRPAWEPHTASRLAGPLEPKRWLIFGGESDFDRALIARLQALQQEVVTALPSDIFAVLGRDEFHLDPGQPAHFDRLAKELAATGSWPDRVLYLWSASAAAGGENRPEPGSGRDATTVPPLLAVVRALGRHLARGEVELGVVGSRLFLVHATDSVDPREAAGLGICRVAPQEYPGLRCRAIDLGVKQAGSTRLAADQLVAEFVAEPRAACVAYRGQVRWVQRFKPQPIGPDVGQHSVLRRHGVYLVTGGLGQIGLLLARYLAHTVQARLALISRSALPPRPEWARMVAERPQDPAAGRVRALLDLEQMGGRVETIAADVSEPGAMQAAVEHVTRTFGAIHGVIHGAAHTGGEALAPIERTDAGLWTAHHRPKAQGLEVLEQLLRDQPIDFWLLHSSLSTVLGGLGFSAYASANCYLDAFAAAQHREGSARWICVNWDGWYFPTGGEASGALPPAILDAIQPAEGIELFRRIFSTAPKQLVVSTYDLERRIDQWVNLGPGSDAAGAPAIPVPPATPATAHPRPALSTDLVGPQNPVQQRLVELWQELLGVAPIGVNDNFFELGGHSLLAVQFVSRVRDQLQVELPVSRVFEMPTVSGLAAAIEQSKAEPAAVPRQPPLVRVARDQYRARITDSGELEIPEKLRPKPPPV